MLTCTFSVIGDRFNVLEERKPYFTLKDLISSIINDWRKREKSDRCVLCEDDRITLLQLCIARREKQTKGVFSYCLSDLKLIQKEIVKIKLDGDENYEPSELYQAIISGYEDKVNLSGHVDLMNVCGIQPKLSSDMCIFVDHVISSQQLLLLEFLFRDYQILLMEDGYKQESTLQAIASLSSDIKQSKTEQYVQQIILSYLGLLYNSRSELCLARCFNVPDRGLDIEAFTCLKREAIEHNKPMFQLASSLIMKLRLGGKSYQQSRSTLKQYVKGLGHLVDFVQNLQTVMEEITQSRLACSKIIKSIKNLILKSQKNMFPASIVSLVAQRLIDQIEEISLKRDAGLIDITPAKSIADGGSMQGLKSRSLLRHLLDYYVFSSWTSTSMDEIKSSQNTPLRLTSVVQQFDSPAEASPDSNLNKSLAQRVRQKYPRMLATKSKTCQSNFSWAQEDESDSLYFLQNIRQADQALCQLSCSPESVRVQASSLPKDQYPRKNQLPAVTEVCELIDTDYIQSNSKLNVKNSITKRSLNLESPSNEKPKTKLRKPRKLIKGQKSLHAFFKFS